MRTSRKTDLNNFSDYDISQPTPSVSLSVPSCSLAVSDGLELYSPNNIQPVSGTAEQGRPGGHMAPQYF